VKACAGTNTQLVNTTDTSLSCGPLFLLGNNIILTIIVANHPISGRYKRNKCFSKDPVINFITPGTYYLRLRTSNSAELKIT
jgi:hypothetical protein